MQSDRACGLHDINDISDVPTNAYSPVCLSSNLGAVTEGIRALGHRTLLFPWAALA